MNIKEMSNRELEDIKAKVDVELQDREYRVKDILSKEKRMWRMEEQIIEGYTNEEVFEDALTMGLTPDDPDVIAGGYSEDLADYIAQKERKESMRTTGA